MAIDTLAITKQALGIAGTDDDDKIIALLEPITSVIETYTGRAFSQASRTEYITAKHQQNIALRFTPVASITSITDRVTGEAVSSDEYELEGTQGLVRRITYGSMWPDGARRYTVVYVGGPADAPPDIRAAFYEMISANLNGQGGLKSEKDGDYSYMRDEGSMQGVPASALSILNRYRARII